MLFSLHLPLACESKHAAARGFPQVQVTQVAGRVLKTS